MDNPSSSSAASGRQFPSQSQDTLTVTSIPPLADDFRRMATLLNQWRILMEIAGDLRPRRREEYPRKIKKTPFFENAIVLLMRQYNHVENAISVRATLEKVNLASITNVMQLANGIEISEKKRRFMEMLNQFEATHEELRRMIYCQVKLKSHLLAKNPSTYDAQQTAVASSPSYEVGVMEPCDDCKIMAISSEASTFTFTTNWMADMTVLSHLTCHRHDVTQLLPELIDADWIIMKERQNLSFGKSVHSIQVKAGRLLKGDMKTGQIAAVYFHLIKSSGLPKQIQNVELKRNPFDVENMVKAFRPRIPDF